VYRATVCVCVHVYIHIFMFKYGYINICKTLTVHINEFKYLHSYINTYTHTCTHRRSPNQRKIFQLCVDEMIPCMSTIRLPGSDSPFHGNNTHQDHAASAHDQVEGSSNVSLRILCERLGALLGENLFREEHRRDIALAYAQGGGDRSVDGDADMTGADNADSTADAAIQGAKKQEGNKNKSPKKKTQYKGDRKNTSYQKALFDKLRSLAGQNEACLKFVPALVGMYVMACRAENNIVKAKGKAAVSIEMAFVKELHGIAKGQCSVIVALHLRAQICLCKRKCVHKRMACCLKLLGKGAWALLNC
jgi:hypothetical protein